ncbi:MAG: hypothetical protein P0116_14935 [Candidatus Nitrosocosmicus sp.]|nr:hypothetical protein [Candidatus Nitrosocosmicus sp.]
MTLKRLCLTLVLTFLTLSIGMISIHSPLKANAQNSASQSGNSDSEQETKQLQSSDQNGQVVSGDSSILSGNNLFCQDEVSSDITQSIEVCNNEIFQDSNPNLDKATLKITTIQRANCHFHPCPQHDGVVYMRSVYGTQSFLPATQTAGGVSHFEMEIPVGVTYQVRGEGSAPLPWMWTFEGANIQNERNACSAWNQCTATMPADGAAVIVNFHYICNDSTC